MKVFISGNSGNQKIENETQKILMVLKTRKKEFEVVDIMRPGNQNFRTFMRERARKKDGQRYPIAPQIFNGDEYKGDFDDFDIANEDNVLEEFLGLERDNPKIEFYKTGAMAPDVGKLKVGKLPKELIEKAEEEAKKKAKAQAEAAASLQKVVEASASSTSSFSGASSCAGGETDSGIDLGDKSEEDSEDEDSEDGNENKSDGNEGDKDGKDKGATGEDDLKDAVEAYDSETDSEDFTDSEDDTVEFMPDGEVIRKCKKGFKQLNNCKRFWKVTNNC